MANSLVTSVKRSVGWRRIDDPGRRATHRRTEVRELQEEGRRQRWKRSRRGPSEMARARWILRRVSHGSSLSLRYLSLAYLLFLPTSCFPRTCFLAPAKPSFHQIKCLYRYFAMLSTTRVSNISNLCPLLYNSDLRKFLFFFPFLQITGGEKKIEGNPHVRKI